MSMKKDLHLFMASAVMSMVGYEPPVSHHVPKKPSKGEAKKCKSCEHFNKGGGKNFCNCTLHRVYIAPMRTACEKYERRRKK
jgi:hypothetical protein